jgi:hypothetical protein
MRLSLMNRLCLLTGRAYNISSRTTQKTSLPLLLYSFVAVEIGLFAEPLFSNDCLYSCLYRGRCLATGLHATIWFLESVSIEYYQNITYSDFFVDLTF